MFRVSEIIGLAKISHKIDRITSIYTSTSMSYSVLITVKKKKNVEACAPGLEN